MSKLREEAMFASFHTQIAARCVLSSSYVLKDEERTRRREEISIECR